MKKTKIPKDKVNLILDLKKSGVSNIDVLNVIEKTERSFFIDESLKKKSNLNIALPIDCGQTISQPLIVGIMTQCLDLSKNMRVLEIGTGSGYHTYILSQLARFVYTIERHKPLLFKSEKIFRKLNVSNIFSKHDDGGLGWMDQAPFDRIIVTASAPEIPQNLLNQLSEDGIMIIPIGDDYSDQVLKKIKKKDNKVLSENLISVRFVPLLEGKEN
ncbi:MAG: Protein-L-isoaspartate O-methyltransferase [Alphaproteobacteria bacterium MarineAlpha8_Bin1]|mgnify:FL=1|nr:MAG: Protein-L-isoaspartate O-methyltransferase [Alphaproteobacteria bacterium MarineAlpha8_Bin1]